MRTIDVLLLRLDAPLMSFGGVRVDDRGVSDETPGLSLLTGLIANALGWDHRDFSDLEHLQDRLRLAVRRDRIGSLLEDFQTVDLGQPWMEPGWTSWHRPGDRQGASGRGTHIRRREYWADAIFTIAVALDPAGPDPSLEAIEKALREPERPLFLGRKPCLPADRLLLGRVEAPSLKAALESAPVPRMPKWTRPSNGRQGQASPRTQPIDGPLAVWWPEGDAPAPAPGDGERRPVYDHRDWANQVHTGRRFIFRGTIEIPREDADGR